MLLRFCKGGIAQHTRAYLNCTQTRTARARAVHTGSRGHSPQEGQGNGRMCVTVSPSVRKRGSRRLATWMTMVASAKPHHELRTAPVSWG